MFPLKNLAREGLNQLMPDMMPLVTNALTETVLIYQSSSLQLVQVSAMASQFTGN